jgi:hypothetical protein
VASYSTLMNSNVPVAGFPSSFSVPTSSSLPLGNVPNSPSPVPSLSQNMVSNSLVTQASDIHSQMMLMMAESFSKLSMVLVETKNDSKSDWPKFSGEMKNIRDWYLSIMTKFLCLRGMCSMILPSMMWF